MWPISPYWDNTQCAEDNDSSLVHLILAFYMHNYLEHKYVFIWYWHRLTPHFNIEILDTIEITNIGTK